MRKFSLIELQFAIQNPLLNEPVDGWSDAVKNPTPQTARSTKAYSLLCKYGVDVTEENQI